MPDPNPHTNHQNQRPFSSSSAAPSPMITDGSEEDSMLSRSEFLSRQEVLKRRSRRVKQLAKIYRDHYWALMEELKLKYREYYWEYGKSPFQEDDENNNGSNNNYANCKSKAMALTRFCQMHILSDAKQKLYKPCIFPVKSSPTGPILCGKPI